MFKFDQLLMHVSIVLGLTTRWFLFGALNNDVDQAEKYTGQ
jgi:hypothetical protein